MVTSYKPGTFVLSIGYLTTKMKVMINKINHKKDIPNTNGYKLFVLINHPEGDYFDTAEVVKDSTTGLHSLSINGNVKYSDVLGWLNMDKNGFPVYIR